MFEKFIELQRYSGKAKTEALKRLQYSQNGTSDSSFLAALKSLLDKNITTNCGVKKFDHEAIGELIFTLNKQDLNLLTIAKLNYNLRDAVLYYKSIERVYGSEAAEVFRGLYTKTLKVGLTAKSVNKALGYDLIPNLGCLLAKRLLEQDPVKLMGRKWFGTEKLDGQRKIVDISDDGVVKIYSGRNGLLDNDYPEIHEYVKYNLEKGFMKAGRAYDGEMIAYGKFDNSIQQRQKTSSICLRKGSKTGVKFVIFDMIKHEDFLKGSCAYRYDIRRKSLDKLGSQIGFYDDSDCGILSVVPVLFATEAPLVSPGKLGKVTETFAKTLWSLGKEGVMLNSATGLWQNGRSGEILKLKKVEDIDLKVVGLEVGSATGKHKESLGALVVEYKGNRVKVGSGYTDLQRQLYWSAPETILGKIITVAHLGESTNQDGGISLNAPVFVDVRTDKGADA